MLFLLELYKRIVLVDSFVFALLALVSREQYVYRVIAMTSQHAVVCPLRAVVLFIRWNSEWVFAINFVT